MSFTPGIPASGQSLGSSRTQVLNNFAVLRSTVATNHIDVNNAGAGKHNLSEYVAQAQAPATTTGEVAMYCRSVSGTSQLFLQQENQLAAATDIQMSRLDKGILNAQTGYSFLPGGLIIQWGRDAFVGAAVAKTVTFPVAFTTACYNVQVLGIGFNNIFHADTETTTTVIVSKNQAVGNGQNFWWMAIGS